MRRISNVFGVIVRKVIGKVGYSYNKGNNCGRHGKFTDEESCHTNVCNT